MRAPSTRWRHGGHRWRGLTSGADVSAVRALGVSRDFLQVLGYTPALGRGFVAAEHEPGGPMVAIISHAMWRTRFGSAADVVGRTIRLNDEPVAIVGVLPESFAFPYEDEPVEVIVPLRTDRGSRRRRRELADDRPAPRGRDARAGADRRRIAHRAVPGRVSEPGVRAGPRDDPRDVQRALR